MIVLGAKIFVSGIEAVSTEVGISSIVLAFLIAPVATELPEKFNSVLWYLRGKDTLALGNITGAMVFQSSIPVSIGIIFTDWEVAPIIIASMFFAIIAIFLIYIEMRVFKELSYKSLMLSGLFYVLYLILIIAMPGLTV
jgi:cation:H+ antiporter